jgi:hypothetical protein
LKPASQQKKGILAFFFSFRERVLEKNSSVVPFYLSAEWGAQGVGSFGSPASFVLFHESCSWQDFICMDSLKIEDNKVPLCHHDRYIVGF